MSRRLRGGTNNENDGGSLSLSSSSSSSSSTTTGMLLRRAASAVASNSNVPREDGDAGDDTKLSDEEYTSLFLEDWEEEENNNTNKGGNISNNNNNNNNKGNNNNNNNKGGNNNKGSNNKGSGNDVGNNNSSKNQGENKINNKGSGAPKLVKGTENKKNNNANKGGKNKMNGNGVGNEKNQRGNGNGSSGTTDTRGTTDATNKDSDDGEKEDDTLPKGGKQGIVIQVEGDTVNSNDKNIANGVMTVEDSKMGNGIAPARTRDEDDAFLEENADDNDDDDDDDDAVVEEAEDDENAEDASTYDDAEAGRVEVTEVVQAVEEAFGQLGEVSRKEEGSIVDDPVLGSVELGEEVEAAEEVHEGSANDSSDEGGSSDEESNTVEVATVVDASKGDGDEDDTIEDIDEDDAVTADNENASNSIESIEKEVDAEIEAVESNLEKYLEGNAVSSDSVSESKQIVIEAEESKLKQIEIEADEDDDDDDEEGIDEVEEGGVEDGANADEKDEKSEDGEWADDDDDYDDAAEDATGDDDEVVELAEEDATEEVEKDASEVATSEVATSEVAKGALLEGAFDYLLSEVAPAGDAEGVAADATEDVAGDANAKSDWGDDDDDDDTAEVAEDGSDSVEVESVSKGTDDKQPSKPSQDDNTPSQTKTPDENAAVGENASDGGDVADSAEDEDATEDAVDDGGANSNGGKVGIVKLKYEKASLSPEDTSVLGIGGAVNGTETVDTGGGNSFDNLQCLDDRNDCGEIAEKGMCGDELFTVVIPASFENIHEVHEGDGVGAVGVGDVDGVDDIDGTKARVAGSGEGSGVVGGGNPAKGDNDDDDDDDDDNVGGAVEVAAGVGEGSAGNLRMEEEVTAIASSDDDDDNDDAWDRRLEDGKSAWGDVDDDDADIEPDNVEVADIEPDDAKGSNAEDVSAPTPSESSAMIVTTGSRHCPVSCNVVKECERARDHYHPDESPSSDKVAVPEVDAEDVTGAETSVDGKGVVNALDDNDDTTSKATDEVVTVDEGAEEGEDEISAGKEAKHFIEGVEVGLERNGGGDSVIEGEQKSNAKEESLSDAQAAPEGATTKEEVVCEDDPSFLYKDKAGFDCAFIAANKPEKCSKLHDGKKVGAVSCPRSCEMVEECKALKTIKLGNVDVLESDEGAVAGGGVGGTEDQSPVVETGASDNEAEGVETVSEGAIIVNATVEGQHSIGEYATNTNLESSDDGPSEFAGNVTAVVEPICEDDPIFLYKNKPGFTCAFLAANKPDKCTKLHDGEKVGAVSCPRSCDMVKECEDMYNISGSVVKIDGIVRGDSVDAVPSDEEGGDEDAGEDAGEVTEERGCDEDDPSFLYHDKPDHDCSFLAEHKPAKCEKLGVTHCPISCNMTDECEAAKEMKSGALDEFGSQAMDEGLAQVGTNSVNVSETAVAGSDIENDIYNSGNTDGQSESSGLDDNGWSADSKDQSTSKSNIESVTASSSCYDDPSFLYKDKEGFTCQFLGTMKPDKCTKLHNGVEIGIASCPESCNMVAQCLMAEASAGKEAGSSSGGVGGETAAASKALDTLSMEGGLFVGNESIMEGGDQGITTGVDGAAVEGIISTSNAEDNGAYTDDEVGGSLQGTYHIGDVVSGESLNEGEGVNVGSGTTVGTKSMMDEIEKGNDGGSFAEVALGQSSGDGPINDSPEFGGEDNGNTYNGSEIGVGAGMEEGKEENNIIETIVNDDDEENDEGQLDNDDGAAPDDNNEWGFMKNEGSNSWDATGGGSEFNEVGSINDSSLGDNSQNLGSTEIGGYQGGENTFNDNMPSGEEGGQFNNAVPSASNALDNDVAATPSTNTFDENLGWDDFDDDGFPAGLFVALLAIFIFFVYRKSTQRNQQEANCTTRGGYQPVQSGDHNKRY